MKKILILGKNGNLGSELMKLYSGESVTGWDRNDIDVTDQEMVAKKITALHPDIVFNCTAYNNVDGAEEDFTDAKQVNGDAPGFLATACKNINAVLVHFSSGQVFAGTNPEGYNEDDQPNPVNAYGRSKLFGEQAVQKSTDQYYIIRTEWLYGKGSGKKSFIDLMLERATENKPMQGVIDEIGKPTWAKDLAEFSRMIIEQKHPYGIYHGINEGQASRYDWAKEIFRIQNLNVNLSPVPASTFPPRKALRPQFELLNNTKLIKLRPWQEALADYLTNT